MALFGNNKKEENISMAPPAPPAPPSAPGASIAPPGMPAPPGQQASSNSFSEESLTSIPKLTTPPMPGGSLDSIKEEVSSQSSNNIGMNNNQMNSSNLPATQKSFENDFSNSDGNLDENSDDLFDFSDLDIPNMDSDDDTFQPQRVSGENFDEEAVDTTQEHLGNLNFVSNRKNIQKSSSSETFFVTTSQFKALLEIVDSVKLKVKESSERHLRLLDIKAEEDVEYENLRKDFQYIEDKLYEVDSLIFEK